MTEKWLPIPGWEGLYEVSNQGRVRSLDRIVERATTRPFPKRGRILTPMWSGSRKPYAHVLLTCGGRSERRAVAHLVCETFNGPRPDGAVCRHLNDNVHDNSAANLAWGTQSENLADAVRNGVHPMAKRTHCVNGHPFSEQNTYLIRGGKKRRCKTCAAEQYRRWRTRKEAA